MMKQTVIERVDLEVQMRKLLALDQSSRTSGYAIFCGSKLEDYGKFTFEDEDLGERLYNIREKVKSLIIENNINEVVFEDIQLQSDIGNNEKTFKILAEVFGVIYELVAEMHIPHSTVLASTWKSTLGIKGAARAEQKRNAQLYVTKTYNIEVSQDESDAISIGTHHIIQSDKDKCAF